MAGTGEELSFTSPEEEIEYWKEKALEYRAKYNYAVNYAVMGLTWVVALTVAFKVTFVLY